VVIQVSASSDRQADISAVLAALSVAIVALGELAIRVSGGWETIGFYFMRLLVVGLIALVTMILGFVAIARGTKKKEKAHLAIFISFIAFVASFVLWAEI
jgi:hypothetical protein